MASVNKAILIGNLGKDPELKYTPSGQAVCSFPLATSERFTDKSGQKRERTEWHNIVAWNKLAELANQYLQKGRSAYIDGRIATRSWDDRDGNKRFKTEVIAREIVFLSGSGGSGSANQQPKRQDNSFQDSPDFESSVNEPDSGVEDDLPF
ncbi:MAG: single-stranded DNA-binding protein [Chitinivibrionales bacterium]|nr:single-stranded DNA-binding protein [Chitinivibrionales bacterium]